MVAWDCHWPVRQSVIDANSYLGQLSYPVMEQNYFIPGGGPLANPPSLDLTRNTT
jgi:hypothetical protein